MSARSVPVTVWTAARRSMVQRAAMAMNAAFYAIVVVVLAELWRAAALSNDGTIAGYSAAAVTWYIATSEAATVSLNSRLIVDIGADIVSGAVVVELLRSRWQVGENVVRIERCFEPLGERDRQGRRPGAGFATMPQDAIASARHERCRAQKSN